MKAQTPCPTSPPMDRIIEQQIDCAQALLGTLQRERQALLDNSLSALEQVSAEKWTAATTLQTLGATLEKFHGGVAGIEREISRSGAAAALRDAWQALLRLADQCQQFNLSNGALLQERQTQLRRTMRALRGSAPDTTYSRAGLDPVAMTPRAFGRV